MTKTNLFISFDRENDRKNGDAEESGRRETRRRALEETVQRVGPVIRETFVEYFRSQGLSTVDYTGDEQVALFKEETGSKEHTWKASSWKKTGTHTEYRADGAHQLDEHTAYTITVSVIVTPENVPLLHFGVYHVQTGREKTHHRLEFFDGGSQPAERTAARQDRDQARGDRRVFQGQGPLARVLYYSADCDAE